LVHQIKVKGILVELESAGVDLATWEKIYGSFFVLHLNVLVIAYEETCLCEFKDMLHIAYWADHLARSDILMFLIFCDRGALNLL